MTQSMAVHKYKTQKLLKIDNSTSFTLRKLECTPQHTIFLVRDSFLMYFCWFVQYVVLVFLASVHCLFDVRNICRYFEELEERIPRAEMMLLKKIVEDCIRTVDEKLVATVCGSFRRGESWSMFREFSFVYRMFWGRGGVNMVRREGRSEHGEEGGEE